MKNQLLRKLFVRGYSRISTAFYHLTDRLFQGKHRWIELKNTHDFPFVGQKVVLSVLTPICFLDAAKGFVLLQKHRQAG